MRCCEIFPFSCFVFFIFHRFNLKYAETWQRNSVDNLSSHNSQRLEQKKSVLRCLPLLPCRTMAAVFLYFVSCRIAAVARREKKSKKKFESAHFSRWQAKHEKRQVLIIDFFPFSLLHYWHFLCTGNIILRGDSMKSNGNYICTYLISLRFHSHPEALYVHTKNRRPQCCVSCAATLGSLVTTDSYRRTCMGTRGSVYDPYIWGLPRVEAL